VKTVGNSAEIAAVIGIIIVAIIFLVCNRKIGDKGYKYDTKRRP
jgi:hypothetical protein